MIRILNSLVILCLARLALTEDRISVDTVGTITATAGYSISDGNNQSPTVASLTSNVDFTKDPSEDASSGESRIPVTAVQGPGGGQSLAQRSRQARGKPAGLQLQQQQRWLQQHDGSSGSGSVENTGVAPFAYTAPAEHYRANEQLYSVKPQTFDGPQPTSSHSQPSAVDGNSGESSAESSAPVTYGKRAQKNNGGHDDRPVQPYVIAAGDWPEDVRVKLDGDADKGTRSRNKQDKPRRSQGKKSTAGSSSGVQADSKEGWQEFGPNMEIATGYSATVQDHGSSQESSDSAESYLKSSMGLFQTPSPSSPSSSSSSESGVSSIENAAPAEPQNFNHKQVLSKMNHFDFSNAVSASANKAPQPQPREKRLNYLQPGAGSPVRFAFGGHPLQPLQVPSTAAAAIKSVKIEQSVPNYHGIVVPMPVSHQMYTAAVSGGGDATSSHLQGLHHQTTGSSTTMQQAMMSLPVVHNVFFKTDENGGGKTMPAIVIPLKPEYLQHLQQQQQQQYSYSQQQSSDTTADSQNAAGHQRPVHHVGGSSKTSQQLQYLQQQLQPSLTPSPYPQLQQKPKSNRVKKPFGLTKDDQQQQQQQQQQQHRVKQPFGLQHQFYNLNPFAMGGVGAVHHHHHPQGHQPAHQHGLLQQVQHGHHAQQHETAVDDTRHAQTAAAPAQTVLQPFAGLQQPMMVKRPHAYGYASPVAVPPAKFVQQVVNKAHQHQQLQQMSAEEVQTALAVQPYKATTFHPGFSYLTSADDDYPYRPVYKDAKKRNDVLRVAQTNAAGRE